jgi:hypothetical protein
LSPAEQPHGARAVHIEKYELVEEVAQIAAGWGKYKKAALPYRLHAFEVLMDRAYGKPRQSTEADGDDMEPIIIKRVIGVSDGNL